MCWWLRQPEKILRLTVGDQAKVCSATWSNVSTDAASDSSASGDDRTTGTTVTDTDVAPSATTWRTASVTVMIRVARSSWCGWLRSNALTGGTTSQCPSSPKHPPWPNIANCVT